MKTISFRKLITCLLLVSVLATACGSSRPATTAKTPETTPVGTTTEAPSTEAVTTTVKPENTEETGGTEASATVRFTDDLGQSFELVRPQRVAVLLGSYTDIWCAAGGIDSVVATSDDSWSTFELALGEAVLSIGSSKKPNLETIVKSNPDLVLASISTSADMALKDSFDQMKLPAAYFEVSSFEDYLRMLKICCELTGHPENYEAKGTSNQAQILAAQARIDGTEPSVLYVRVSSSVCSVKNSEGSVLGELLADLGCRNIADSETSLLEELSMEVILKQDPEHIFVVLQGGSKSDAPEKMFRETLSEQPAWSSLTAVKKGNVHIMDERLYNYKPNALWGEAYEKLADILYPAK